MRIADYEYLRANGYVGAAPDMLKAFLLEKTGLPSNTPIPELYYQWLGQLGATGSTLPDRMKEIALNTFGVDLSGLGGSQSLLDQIQEVGINLLEAYTPVRSGTTTYWDNLGVLRVAPANTKIVEYNPLDGSLWGHRFEETATNRLLHSAAFGNAYWSKTGTAENASSVKAGEVATKITGTAVGSQGVFTGASAIGAIGSVRHCLSAIFEKGNSNKSDLTLVDRTLGQNIALVSLNYTTGLTTLVNSAQASGTVYHGATKLKDVGPNGGEVYLVWVSAVGSIPTNDLQAFFLPKGAQVDTLFGYLHAVQLETSAQAYRPSSYIPTTTSSAIRGTDLSEIAGTAYSDIFTDEFSILAEGRTTYRTSPDGAASLYSMINVAGGTDTRCNLSFYNGAQIDNPLGVLLQTDAANGYLNTDSPPVNYGEFHTLAASWGLSEQLLSFDGSPITVASTPRVLMDKFAPGSFLAPNQTRHLGGHLKRLLLRTETLSQTELDTWSS